MISAIKAPRGLKTVMTLLASEENSNKASQSELTAALAAKASSATTTTQEQPVQATGSISSAYPATQIKLNSILKASKKV